MPVCPKLNSFYCFYGWHDLQAASSNYLDVLDKVVSQCNLYSSENSSMACQMVQSIKENTLKQNSEQVSCVNCFTPEEQRRFPFKLLLPQTSATENEAQCEDLPVVGSQNSPVEPKHKCSLFKFKIRRDNDGKYKLVSTGSCRCKECPGRFHGLSTIVVPNRHATHSRIENHQKRSNEAKILANKQVDIETKERSGISVKDEKCTITYCIECNAVVPHEQLSAHLAMRHIKKPTLFCSHCDYTSTWKLRKMKRHRRKEHPRNMKVRIINKRHKLQKEIETLKERLIKHNTPAAASTTIFQKQKWDKAGTAYCQKCEMNIEPQSVYMHLAGKRHLNRRSLFCNHCKFSTFWGTDYMKCHLKEKHGATIEFTDKRDEVRDLIQTLADSYIIIVR